MKIKNKIFGFTLAEVLITLGIIGVVAAITIPNLMTNINHKVWASQLKKEYAMLTQGFRRMLADAQTDDLSQTEAFAAIGDQGICLLKDKGSFDSEECQNFYKKLGDYFKIASVKFEVNTNDPGSGETTITFLDGLQIGSISNSFFNYGFKHHAGYDWRGDEEDNRNQVSKIRQYCGRDIKRQADFVIDINGDKKPNEVGKDRHALILANDGSLHAEFSPCGIALGGHWDWNELYENLDDEMDGFQEYAITAKVMANGWSFDY